MKATERFFLMIVALAAGIALVFSGCAQEKPKKAEKAKSAAAVAKKKKTTYKVGYEEQGLQKTRPKKMEIFTPEELEAFAAPTGPGEAAIVFAGDTMIWDRMKKQVETKGWDYPFRGVAPFLKNADLAVLNLEGPLADQSERRRIHNFFYQVPTQSVQGLIDAGIDAVTLGNNHLLDCNEGGLEETLRTLDRAGIKWFGAGDSDEKARTPLISDVKGIRIAQVGGISPEIYLTSPDSIGKEGVWERRLAMCKRDLTMIDGANKMGTFLYTPETLAEDIRKAKSAADIVIANLHFGVRYWRPPFKEQVELAKAAKEAGADLIIGHHAHFWQPVEMMGLVPVIYGIGNFAFGSGNTNADEGLLVRAIFSTETRKLTRVELYPTYIKNRDPLVNYQVKILKGKSARAVLEDLQAWSRMLSGTNLTIDKDRAVIDLPSA